MKKHLLTLSCVISLCLQWTIVKANYAVGGELIYEWISGSNYRFYLKLYRDCGGSTEPNTLPLCFTNSCGGTTFSTTLAKYSFPTPPPAALPCAGFQTKCYDPSSTINGYKETWYFVDVTLSTQCNSWKMFVPLALTRPATSNISGSSVMHVEATLNNTGTLQGNSSPYYTNSPFFIGCQGNLYKTNNGAVDPNGDSLVHEVIQPLNAPTSCAGTATPVSFPATTPALSVPGNPFQTNGSFSLNQQTGQISFTPTQAGRQTLTIRTKEYRNNVLVGSVMREVTMDVYNCGAPTMPTLTITGNTVNGAFHTCPGQPINFCYDIKSQNTSTEFSVSDNHTGMFGSTLVYQNQKTDSVRGCFSWTPTVNDAGKYNLTLFVTDSSCNFPGLISMNYFTVPIYVWDKVNAQADESICLGESVKLLLNAGGIDTWQVLSGDLNSLSCSGCSNPIATPTISSQYEVTLNNLPPACPVKKDTVSVNIVPVNLPNLSIAANTGNDVWPGLNVTFTATTVYCNTPYYQWRINGNDVAGANGPTFSTTTLADNDIITCLLSCSDTCIIDTPSNAITMNVATGIHDIRATAGKLYPNPNNGSFTISDQHLNGSADLTIINVLGEVVWSQRGVKVAEGQPVTVEAGSLPAGQYTLKMTSSGNTETIRFIVSQ